MTARPQKITFGEMRDMGVRGTPAPDLVKKQTMHSSPPPFRAQGIDNLRARPDRGIIGQCQMSA
jgi:hypothetical protein